jgi:hypothetical protein
MDHGRMAATVARLGFPLVTARSKSGGAHLYLFTKQPIDAGTMQDKLRDMAARLGHGGAEIFPKQRKLMPKECGGWINAVYFDMERTNNRYAVLANGDRLTAEQFLNLAELVKVSPSFFEASVNKGDGPLPGGPPCLQHLVTLGFPEGSRNNALLNLGVYAKHVNPDTFASDVENFNRGYMQPPLDSSEVSNTLKSLMRKDYSYTCSKDPLTPYCNSIVCRTRKYGIGGGTAASLPVLGALTKYDSKPPLYWWDVDGLRIELTDEEILDYRKFKRACFARLNKVLPHLTEKKWHELLRKSTETMTTESVPPDASPEGQFWEHLEQFCNGRAQAQTRLELMAGNKPLTEDGKVFFKLSALLNFLDRVKFRHLNLQRVAAVLTSRGGQASKITVQGKQLRVWSVPAFTRA